MFGSIERQSSVLLEAFIFLFKKQLGKISWRRAWQPTPAFMPGESPWTEEPCRVQSIGSQSDLKRLSSHKEGLSWSKESLCVRKRRKENHKIIFFSWKKMRKSLDKISY